MDDVRTSSDNHRVEIRDARGVVIGDNNVVHQYFVDERYRPLAEHLIAFEDLIAERTADFVGRAFLDARLATFMEQHDRGYIVLVGEPGIGKTAWAAHVVREYQALHHFNVSAMGIVRPDQALENLCAQIIARFRLDQPYLPVNAGRDGSFFDRLLRQAAERLNGSKLVIVIDALDEAQMPAEVRGTNPLYMPSALPAGVYFVLTRRPQPVPLQTAPGTPSETFTLDADLSDNRSDVRVYLGQQAARPGIAIRLADRHIPTERFIEELAERSAGNFMYLAYLLPDIAAGLFDPLNLTGLPQGLRGYYERFWNELESAKGEGPEAWTKFYKPVIGVLAATREPVSAVWIGCVLDLDPDMVADFALARWRKFLYCAATSEPPLWRLYHESFTAFLVEKLEGTHEHQRKIADWYLADGSPQDRWLAHKDNGYCVRHLCLHLAETDQRARLINLVLSREWWSAKRIYDRSGRTLGDDAWLAAQAAEAEYAQALKGSHEGRTSGVIADAIGPLAQLFALTVAIGHLQRSADNVPIEAIAGLVTLSQVSLAFDYAQRVSDAYDHTGAGSWAVEAGIWQSGCVLEQSKRAEVYRRIALACLDRAGICQQGSLDRPLEHFCDQARSALIAASSILENEHQGAGIEQLIPLMTRAGMHSEVRRLVQRWNVYQNDEREEPEWGDRSRSDGYTPDPVLREKASLLATTGMNEVALDIIADIRQTDFDYLDQKGRALANAVEAFAGLLPSQRISEFLQEAWEIVSDNPRRDFRTAGQARVITVMHRLGMRPQASTLLKETIKAAKDIWPFRDLAFALEALAWAAAQNEDVENLFQVLSESENMRDWEWEEDTLTSRLEAALADVGAFFTPFRLLSTAWQEAEWKIHSRNPDVAALVAGLAQGAIPTDALKLVEEHSSVPEVKAQFLCNVAVALFETGYPKKSGLLIEAAIRSLEDHRERPRLDKNSLEATLSALKTAIARTHASAFLRPLGDAVLHIRGSELRDRAIVKVIAEMLSSGVDYEAALRLCSHIKNISVRVHALTKVARHLVEEHQSNEARRIVDESLQHTHRLDNALEQVKALIEVGEAKASCAYYEGLLDIASRALRLAFSLSAHEYSDEAWQLEAEEPIRSSARAHLLGRCIDLFKSTTPGEWVEQAVGFVKSESNQIDKAYLARELADTLSILGQAAVSEQLLAETRKEFGNRLPIQKETARERGWHWTLGEASRYLVETARALALLEDTEGILALVGHARYLTDPEWRGEHDYYGIAALSYCQAETLGGIVACLVQIGQLEQARALMEEAQDDQSRNEMIWHFVRASLTYQRTTKAPVDWLYALADQVNAELYGECAQRMSVWLAALRGTQDRAWLSAKKAVGHAARALAGQVQHAGLFRCVADTVDALLSLRDLDAVSSLEFLIHALRTARGVGGRDTWAFISALYPLLARVGGREAAEEVWRCIQNLQSITQDDAKANTQISVEGNFEKT